MHMPSGKVFRSFGNVMLALGLRQGVSMRNMWEVIKDKALSVKPSVNHLQLLSQDKDVPMKFQASKYTVVQYYALAPFEVWCYLL